MLIAAAITIIIAIEAFLILIFYIIFEKIEKNTIQCFDEIDKMKFCFLFKYEVKKQKSILGAKIIKVKPSADFNDINYVSILKRKSDSK